jgi:hypothetical protein
MLFKNINAKHIPAVELTTIRESLNETSACVTPPSVTMGEGNGPKLEPVTVNALPPAVETPLADAADVTTGRE